MMLSAILWKEYREQRLVWLTLAVVAVGTLVGFSIALGGESWQQQRTEEMLYYVAVVLAWTHGLVCGAMLLAGEREAGTQTFLDTLPASRLPLWLGKALAGALMLALMLVLLGGLSLGLNLRPAEGWPAGLLALCVGGLMGFGWGLFCSSLTRSVLPAIGLGFLAQWLVLPVAYFVLTMFRGLVWVFIGWDPAAEGVLAGMALVCLLLPLPLSALVYSRVDRQRRPLSFPVVAALESWGEGWRQAFWLSAVQARGLLVGLVVFSLAAGLAAAAGFALAWPLLTLGVGALCGVSAFLDEQSGAYRFLGEQRLPLTRLWLVKLSVRLALAVFSAVLIALPSLVLARFAEDRASQTREHVPVMGSYLLELIGSPVLFTVVWLVHGFAAGQLCGLVFRKPLVAMVVSLGLAAVLVSFWVPSLVVGGLALWQVYVVPLVLLVCGRLMLYPWAADRLASWDTVARLAGAVALCAALTALGLWYRTVQVPDVSEPEDYQAFLASLPSPEQNEAGRIVQSACDRLADLEKQWRLEKAPVRFFPGKGDTGYLVQCREVVQRGYPDDQPALARWLDGVFKDEVWKRLEGITQLPTGVVEDPRRLHLGSRYRYLEPAVRASELLAVRGLQMQKVHKRPEAFVGNLRTGLALVRNLAHDAPTVAAVGAEALENTQLKALDHWLEQLAGRTDLLRQTLGLLQAHREAIPINFHVHQMADYLVALQSLDAPADWLQLYMPRSGLPREEQNLELAVLATAWSVPWELAREKRAIRYLQWSSDRWPGRHFHLLHGLVRYNGAFREARLLRRRCRVSAMVLTVALRLYQAEKGQPARTLEALVPAYLPAVPADPFGNGPFHYRLSEGEEITWPQPQGPPAPRRIPAGTGVLWSVGDDGRNDGGRRGCDPNDRCLASEDIIFLVPLPAREKR
jgi:hypothetical protein